jgi:hypothetical protein
MKFEFVDLLQKDETIFRRQEQVNIYKTTALVTIVTCRTVMSASGSSESIVHRCLCSVKVSQPLTNF